MSDSVFVPVTDHMERERRVRGSNAGVIGAGKYIALGALLLATAAEISTAHADDGLRDLCPDRPGKGTSACTVDPGYFQLESDIFNGTFQRAGSISTETYYVTDPNLKYGVSGDFDIEASIAPDVIVRSHDSRTGATQTWSGIGDLYLRAKWAAVGNSGDDVAVTIEPYVKLPTAPVGVGNGFVEGGVVTPISIALNDGWSVAMTPELDVLKNSASQGRHLIVSDVVGVGRTICSGITLGAEIWESTSFDPYGTTQFWSFDFDGAWQPDGNPNLQFDAGINIGLNRATPNSQVYAGVTRRF
jgi:hypothetical protein